MALKYHVKNGQRYVYFQDSLRESMKDPAFKKEWDALKPKYDLIQAILDARIKDGVTQKELARRVGTTQSAIARFESGAVNPTLDFMAKISAAVGAKLEVRISR